MTSIYDTRNFLKLGFWAFLGHSKKAKGSLEILVGQISLITRVNRVGCFFCDKEIGNWINFMEKKLY